MKVEAELTDAEKREIKAIEKETSQIREESKKTKNESLKATERLVKVGEQTKDVGKKTLTQLHEQGDQIRRIENREAKVSENIEEADRHVSRYLGGLNLLGFGRQKKKKREAEEKQRMERQEEERVLEEEMRRQEEERAKQRVTTVTPGRHWLLMNPHTKSPGSQRPLSSEEDQTEAKIQQNLGIVEEQVAELLEQSRAMGEAMEAQDAGIQRVIRMAEKNDIKVGKTKKNVGNL